MHELTTAALSFPGFSPALIEVDLGFLGFSEPELGIIVHPT